MAVLQLHICACVEFDAVCSKRKNHNFDGLVMDDEGNIDVEESNDKYNDKYNTKKLLSEAECENIQP